jgi:hypothetical protein
MISSPKEPGGSGRIAAYLKHSNRFGKSAVVRSSRTVRVSHTNGGIFLGIRQQAGGGLAKARRLQISSVSDNYVTGNILNPNGSLGAQIDVAIPLELRKSSYDGLTISGWTYAHIADGQRSITNQAQPSYTGTQFVEPWWYGPSHPIFFLQASTGITNLTGSAILYVDLNNDDLRWEMEKTLLQVCLDGVLKPAILQGSVNTA